MAQLDGGRPVPRGSIALPVLALIAAASSVYSLVTAGSAAPAPLEANQTRTSGAQGRPTLPSGPVAFLDASRGVHRMAVAAFPGAMKGSVAMSRLLSAVRPYGLTRSNTIYGHSTCPDEINGYPGHLTTLLTKYYGASFALGGLAGAPHVGRTGFFGFSNHVPQNGHVLVVFGPHIGFTPEGVPGKYLRSGQPETSLACGALNHAYAQLTAGASMPARRRDAQQTWVRDKLKPYIPEVKSSSQPMVELVMKFYNVVEEEMLHIINLDYGPGNLVLLGGIVINMPYPRPGYFMPLHFSIRSSTMEPKDLMSAFS